MKKIILGIIILVGYFVYQTKTSFYKGETVSEYYQNLRKECEQKNSKNCCLASVKRMEDLGAYAVNDYNGVCDYGYKKEMLKCLDSFAWCQKQNINDTSKFSFYENLRDRCKLTGVNNPDQLSCCLDSIKTMEIVGSTMLLPIGDYKKPVKEFKCPNGLEKMTLRCNGSYTWCQISNNPNGEGAMLIPGNVERIKKIDEVSKIRKEKNNFSNWYSPEEYQKKLGVGIDVDWAEFRKIIKNYTSQLPKDFKKMGFSHVRIRVRADSDFSQIEKTIDDSLTTGLIPILAFSNHNFELNPDSEEALEGGVNWWKETAEKLKNKNPKLSFNLMIEVSDALNKKPERLNLFYKKAIAEIRKTNPNRIILISPRIRSAPEYLGELEFPKNDKNIMVEFHFYASGPDKTNPKKKWTIGTEEEKNLIRNKIKLALDFQKKTGRRVWVGAWMAGNYNKGNDYSISEQEKFAKFVVGELQKAGTPYAINSGKRFYDYEKKKPIREMEKLRKIIINKK